MVESLSPRDNGNFNATECEEAVDAAIDTLRAELTPIRARAPSVLDHIKSRLRELCEWASEDIGVDETWNARQSAPQSGSALSATNPPGWRPAALDDSGDLVLVQSSSSLASSKQAISSGTAAISSNLAEGLQAQTNTSNPASLRNWNDAGERNAQKTTDLRKTPAGSQTSSTNRNVAEPAGITPKTSSNTLTSVSSPSKAPNVPLHEADTPGAVSRIADVDISIREIPNASTVRPTCEGDEEQETRGGGEGAGEGVGQEEGETIRAWAQQNEDRSEDRMQRDDDGEDGYNKGRSGDEDDAEEEISATAESRAVPEVNNEGRQKEDGHMVVHHPLSPVAPLNPIRVSGEAAGLGQCAEDNTKGAQDSTHHQSAAPVHQSAYSGRAVADGNTSEAHADQSAADVEGVKAVSAQDLPSSWLVNRPVTASLLRTSSGSEDDDSNDGDISPISNCTTLNAVRVLDDEVDNDDMPTHEPETGRKSGRASKRRALTAAPNTFQTPMKRQRRSADIADLANSVVKKVPRHLIQPAKLHQLIADVLGDSDSNSVMPLMGFFFSLASPSAIERLRDACVSVRNSQRHSSLPEEAGVLQSMQALDRIDMHEHVSPILRRYHLVQLVKRRDKIYNEIVASGAQFSPLVRKRGLRKQTATSASEGTKRAAAAALERLVSEAYPDDRLQITEGHAKDKATQREKRFKKLKNRLSDGQNWNLLQERFGIGILALVYTGPDAGFSNTVIERIKHNTFSKVLNLLHEHRGDKLLQISKTISEQIYDVLLGRPGAPVFVFEDAQEELNDALYDSPALIRKCELQDA